MTRALDSGILGHHIHRVIIFGVTNRVIVCAGKTVHVDVLSSGLYFSNI